MRGRNTDYFYLEPEILEILKESEVPMSALGINFRVNNKFDKIIELNTVKRHLDELVKNKKLVRVDKEDTPFYVLNSKNR